MKSIQLTTLALVLLLLALVSCEDNPATTHNIDPNGSLTSQTECKNFGTTVVESEFTAGQSAIEYSYDEANNTLYLTHINAGFNCCPGEITADVSNDGNTITIIEAEEAALCNCNCLFDLEIKIENINTEIYNIEIIEQYISGQDELIFTIDLSKANDGVYSVDRTIYPWGLNTIIGGIIEHTECKPEEEDDKGKISTISSEYTSSQSCVEYSYDKNERILHLTHINAGFNCCPGELTADITNDGNIITITEAEEEAGCKCNCLYDLEIEVENVGEIEYILEFIEPYAGEHEELIFTINLKESSTGVFSVKRDHYPWGL